MKLAASVVAYDLEPNANSVRPANRTMLAGKPDYVASQLRNIAIACRNHGLGKREIQLPGGGNQKHVGQVILQETLNIVEQVLFECPLPDSQGDIDFSDTPKDRRSRSSHYASVLIDGPMRQNSCDPFFLFDQRHDPVLPDLDW